MGVPQKSTFQHVCEMRVPSHHSPYSVFTHTTATRQQYTPLITEFCFSWSLNRVTTVERGSWYRCRLDTTRRRAHQQDAELTKNILSGRHPRPHTSRHVRRARAHPKQAQATPPASRCDAKSSRSPVGPLSAGRLGAAAAPPRPCSRAGSYRRPRRAASSRAGPRRAPCGGRPCACACT